MTQSKFRFSDFMNAETVVDYLVRNSEIDFQIRSETMPRAEFEKHLNDRQALIRVKMLLLDAAEHANGGKA